MDILADVAASGACWGTCTISCYTSGGEVVILTAFGALGGFAFEETI